MPGYEDQASDWIRFARTQSHDSYWAYRDAFFELLPPPPALALEIGCGEGRVSRDLRVRGYEVTGLDVSPTLAEAAREADPGGTYVVGDAAALPFEDGTFRPRRLLQQPHRSGRHARRGRRGRPGPAPGGAFCACVPHPFSEAGEFTGDSPDAAFVVAGSYLEESTYEIVSDRGRSRFRFRCRRFPLESYARALERAGLAIEVLREPPLPGAGMHRRARIPLFLLWRAMRIRAVG